MQPIVIRMVRTGLAAIKLEFSVAKLHLAAQKGDSDRVSLLLELKDANVKGKAGQGTQAVHWAASAGFVDVRYFAVLCVLFGLDCGHVWIGHKLEILAPSPPTMLPVLSASTCLLVCVAV